MSSKDGTDSGLSLIHIYIVLQALIEIRRGHFQRCSSKSIWSNSTGEVIAFIARRKCVNALRDSSVANLFQSPQGGCGAEGDNKTTNLRDFFPVIRDGWVNSDNIPAACGQLATSLASASLTSSALGGIAGSDRHGKNIGPPSGPILWDDGWSTQYQSLGSILVISEILYCSAQAIVAFQQSAF